MGNRMRGKTYVYFNGKTEYILSLIHIYPFDLFICNPPQFMLIMYLGTASTDCDHVHCDVLIIKKKGDNAKSNLLFHLIIQILEVFYAQHVFPYGCRRRAGHFFKSQNCFFWPSYMHGRFMVFRPCMLCLLYTS